MRHKRVGRKFFQQPTQTIARSLLGKVLVRRDSDQVLTGRITEVESYSGLDDLASHASRGRTVRTDVMFGPPGRAYIYVIYGMYHCLNIVTEAVTIPAAVLIRAVEPLDGISIMQKNRRSTVVKNLTTGPGKLTQAFAITRALNHEDLTISKTLFIADDAYTVPPTSIATSPRIGVAYAGQSALLPWRYYLKDSPFVSTFYSK